MTRATWDDTGSRLYHVGVDRGMLYVGDDIMEAVPWNGLASVTESPAGGDPQTFYLDGRAITSLPIGEDFAGSIETYAAPIEFAPCAGRLRVSTGLYASEQPRTTFGFSYRTLIGSDSAPAGFAYKVHVVYNATAQISDFSHGSDSSSPSVTTYSWAITTVPVSVPGFKPSAHYVFDSRLVDPDQLAEIEFILYGSETTDPRIPSIDELAILLQT
jgi:hypothetical protein